MGPFVKDERRATPQDDPRNTGKGSYFRFSIPD